MLTQIISRERDLGGFSVRRVLPSPQRKMVGPFIFFDHMGPASFSPGSGINVRPHPHINLATVTYLFDGEIHHRDSLGSNQIIHPGAVNWMTAGRGIVHSERTTEQTLKAGFHLNGIQLWVALPLEFEESEPTFVHHPANDFQTFNQGKSSVRVILGSLFGHKSPVRVHSDLFYVEVKIPKGETFIVPFDGRERAFYVVSGQLRVENETVQACSMAIATDNSNLSCVALEDVHMMLLGGSPVGERFIDWNFVSSSKDRIEEAKNLWRQTPSSTNPRFQTIPGDDLEMIPLP